MNLNPNQESTNSHNMKYLRAQWFERLKELWARFSSGTQKFSKFAKKLAQQTKKIILLLTVLFFHSSTFPLSELGSQLDTVFVSHSSCIHY